jgi:4Fe-4S binding domain
MTLRWN